MNKSSFLCCLALAVLLCLPALASEDVIFSGVDIWRTPGDGLTFSNFFFNPIPAGFFCDGSAPFTGKIGFRGVPLKTDPPGTFGDADTVIERLDDAAFDLGLARTRVRFAGLNLESISPVETECGAFNVRVRLHGEQPITSMVINRKDDFDAGGTMSSRLAAQVMLSFVRVGGLGKDEQPRELIQEFSFAPNRGMLWSYDFRRNSDRGLVKIDVDLDGELDTEVPAASNFAPGNDIRNILLRTTATTIEPNQNCHCDPSAGGSWSWGTISCDPDPDHPECEHLHCTQTPNVLPRQTADTATSSSSTSN